MEQRRRPPRGAPREAGYETTLQYADNKVDQQITQLQNMINQGADVLVIASIDGTALGPVLDAAAKEEIPVIAYDRLINDSEHVDYYATFDNEKVGTLQGEFIAEQLGLAGGAARSTSSPSPGRPTTTTPASSSREPGTS
ncbi:substrate-binding domain-containing protein [Oerskovia sp. M15]